jgi:hypothetical protein
MKALAFGLAALLLTATPSLAARRQVVALGDTSMAVVDVDSMARKGDVVRYWSTYVTARTQDSGADYFVSLSDLNCAEMTQRTVALNSYRLDGESLVSNESPGPWEHVVPDSTLATVADFVCGRTQGNPELLVTDRTLREMAEAFRRTLAQEGK